jgi:hypothetical protein
MLSSCGPTTPSSLPAVRKQRSAPAKAISRTSIGKSAIWTPTRCAIDQQCCVIVSVSSDNPRPPALPAVLGRVGQAIGSLLDFAVCLR